MAPAPLNARLSRENVEVKKRFLNDKSGKTLRRVMYACIELESFRLAFVIRTNSTRNGACLDF